MKATPQPLFSAAPKPEPVNWLRLNAEAELQRRRKQGGIGSISSWPTTTTPLSYQPAAPQLDAAPASEPGLSKTIVVHPTLALALLKAQLEAPGRVYLLLRHIDHQGRGWLQVEDIRRQLTRKDSPLWICGWRRLRQLLHKGEGIFWHRNVQGQVWLMGLHRIAFALDLTRTQGFPIELPVEVLLGGIQAVRAAFYATFHSGRDSKPISRDTLESLSGIPGRTQLEYDRVAGVERTRNIAIGERVAGPGPTAIAQERAWRHGRAAFHFIDSEGRQGRAALSHVKCDKP